MLPRSGEASGPEAAAANSASATVPLFDGRQIFFLFVGSACVACLIFALGVYFGRRAEQQKAAQAQAQATTSDPLAVLDEIAAAEEALTFHRAVLEPPRPPTNPQAPDAARPPVQEAPHYTLLTATLPDRGAATALAQRLRALGQPVMLVESRPAGKPVELRLQFGNFPTPATADAAKAELLRRFSTAATVTKL